MHANVVDGFAALQTFPEYRNERTAFGGGYCGSQSYTVELADGSDSSAFLTVSSTLTDGTLSLQSSDPLMAGSYLATMKIFMTDYSYVNISQDFLVYLINFWAEDSVDVAYIIDEDPALEYTPACFVDP